jgi:hypothetical protein
MKKLKNRGFLSQQAAELAKTFVKGIQKSHGCFVLSGTFFKCNYPAHRSTTPKPHAQAC